MSQFSNGEVLEFHRAGLIDDDQARRLLGLDATTNAEAPRSGKLATPHFRPGDWVVVGPGATFRSTALLLGGFDGALLCVSASSIKGMRVANARGDVAFVLGDPVRHATAAEIARARGE